jgi:wobble nucleotide-excising tRNase
MLKQVKKIKALGVFESYAAPADLPPLKRYNVIYGENGSGKTTLSGLFASLETGAHHEYPNLYVVRTFETLGACF